MDFAQPPSAASQQQQQQDVTTTLSTVDNKILADLNVVIEKMDLLDSMVKPGADSPAPSLKTHESLLTVIGFLEACAPRMIELVEAAAQGALSGIVLEQCLAVNDRLLKQLQEIDTMAMTETAASTTAASAPTEDLDNLLLDDDDFDFDDDNKKSAAAAAPTGPTKSTGEDDDDEDLFGTGKLPADNDSKPAAAASEDIPAKDSFDDFLAERTAAQAKQEDN